MKYGFAFLIFLAVQFANAAAEIRPLHFGLHECDQVEVPAVKLNPKLQEKLDQLPIETIETLNRKRQEVFDGLFELAEPHLHRFGYILGPLSCALPNGKNPRQIGIAKLARMLRRLDAEMLKNATIVSECSRWGVCTTLDLHASIGFLSAHGAKGFAFSIDNTTAFGKNEWQRDDYIDIPSGSFAYTPVALLNAGLNFVVHFDSPVDSSIRDFELVHYPSVPLKVGGQNSFGYGMRTGLGFPFGISSLFWYKHKVSRRSADGFKATCSALLGIKN